jgi:hypothetical protein
MPTYQFKHKQTGEITEVVLKMSEKGKYIEENPDLETHFGYVPNTSYVGSVNVKRNTAFNEVLSNIHKRTPGSILNKTTNI